MDWGSLIPSGISILTGMGVVAIVLVKFRKILKEVVELLTAVTGALSEASEGGTKITPSELQLIIKEAKDIPEAIKEIGRKK